MYGGVQYQPYQQAESEARDGGTTAEPRVVNVSGQENGEQRRAYHGQDQVEYGLTPPDLHDESQYPKATSGDNYQAPVARQPAEWAGEECSQEYQEPDYSNLYCTPAQSAVQHPEQAGYEYPECLDTEQYG